MSAGLNGEIMQHILMANNDKVKEIICEYQDIFKVNFYLEIQNHGIEHEQVNVDKMQKLSKELNLPLVATNDAHYAKHD